MPRTPHHPRAPEIPLVRHPQETPVPDIRRDPGVLSAGDIRVPGQLDGFQAAGGDVFVVGYFFDGALVGHFGEALEDCVGLDGVGLLRW